LDPDCAQFVLSEEGFCSQPDWRLTLLADPQIWFNETMAAIHLALVSRCKPRHSSRSDAPALHAHRRR